MTKQKALEHVLNMGIVPVVRVSSSQGAMLAAEALRIGGISIVEITMTTPGAVDVIAQLSRSLAGQVLVGAGTVLDLASARECLKAGAEFLVSPVLDEKIVEFANEEEKLMMAGALTPTEIVAAWNAGSDLVKVFPCSSVGGAQYIRALKGPLPHIPLVPTGGVNLNNAADFIRAGAAAIGIGSELVPSQPKESTNSTTISLAKKYVAAIGEARQPADSIIGSGSTKSS